LAAAGTVCRAAESICDVAETCNGTSSACPTDTFAAAGTACGAATSNSSAPVCSGSAGTCPVASGTSDVLGFEAQTDWALDPSDSGTTAIVGLNSNRTQGESSFEVAAQNFARFNSAPMSSIGSVGPIVLLDVLLPTSQANPSWYGDGQMFVSSPSLGINNVPLGDVPMTGLALGTWQTLAFQMPAATAATIAHGVYSDLTFSVVLNVPFNETGHYLLDNIRSIPDVVPSLLGVAQDGATLKAIFGYQTTSSTPVNIPYGTANGLTNQNGFIASPPEVPPTTFVSTTHAPFVATLSGTLLTWTVGSHSVTATPGSQQLPVTNNGDGTHDATLPNGTNVNIDSVPPASPVAAGQPPVGAPFNGVVGGQLSISPSGAATYTVPISVPAGVAGMAPNLALVYNSQGGDGIAGQGWALSGLSRIARCPRTRQQDGYGRPVTLDSLNPSQNSDGLSDGICMDGQKLFETSPGSGSYVNESQDFSTITLDKTTGGFDVVTKAGETRYYNSVVLSGILLGAPTVWLLSRVVDRWGNYFDIQYNNGQGNVLPGGPEANSYASSGIWVSKIDYTGSLTAQGCGTVPAPASCTPNTVTFQYECRPDTRWTRYNTFSIPQAQRLKSITTPQGTYSLTYTQAETSSTECLTAVNPQSGGLSELQSIGYCAGSTCMQALNFGWKTTRGSQPFPTGYAIPSFVVPGRALSGTQFVDLNGDGRPDFILARTNGSSGKNVPQVATVLNTGNGWGPQLGGPGQKFPAYLADANDSPTGVRFADLDGDGLLDLIIDSANVMCTTTTVEGQGQTSQCLSCPVGVAPGNPGCIGSLPYGPAVWLNRFTLAGGGGWEFHSEYSGQPVVFTGSSPTMVGDLDGDGKADLIRVTQQAIGGGHGSLPTTANTTITTLLNRNGWVPQTMTLTTLPPFGSIFTTTPQFQIQDVNRDGLSDIVHDDYSSYPDGSIASSETVLINQGVDAANNVRFALQAPRTAPTGGSPIDVTQRPPHFADIDGDGFYDLVEYASSNSAPGYTSGIGFGEGTGYGFGVTPGGAGLYGKVLAAFSPPSLSIDPVAFGGVLQDYGYALVDIDGDGLVDLVRNHWQRAQGSITPLPSGGGEVLLNNGTTWLSELGNTKWQVDSFGPGRIPFEIPSEASAGAGSAFVDLDGDGMTDLIQEEVGDSNLQPGVWFNPNVRPVITTFPNGLAQSSTVSYVSITSAAGSATYKDDDGTTDPNTKTFAVPMNVVSSLSVEDGTGKGGFNTDTTTYTYHSLRQDSFGRGPLGFHRVEVIDQASQVRTVTTYAQAYPYTGMPTEVDKYQVVGSQSHLTNKTTTSYCDTVVAPSPPGLGCGAAQPGPIPPGTTTFVHPFNVVDIAYLHPESDDLTNEIVTNTLFEFDPMGNSTFVDTRVTRIEGVEESFDKTVRNTYSTPEEQLEGYPDSTIVFSTGGTNSTTHTTTFEYSPVSTFGGVGSHLALAKKHVEPGAGWPVQLDTAYAFDQFGNVVTTTSCASDFGNCTPGATNPSTTSDPVHHPPFRTTSVSYDPSVLGAPVSYGIGRFPTQTTNALGQTETTIYDPLLGKVLTAIGPSGIKTCYAYDPLGRLSAQTDRCNSTTPLVTNTSYFLTLPRVSFCPDPGCVPDPTGFSPPNSKVVTVITSPSGATAWTYVNDQGKTTGTLAYAFDGGFIETTNAYNALGQVTQISTPFELASFSDQTTPAVTTTTYDSFNRLQSVTVPLGVIDSSGASKSTTTTTTYNGSTIETDRVVNGKTQTRLETKNAIGKVASETTETETGPSTITYAYDADGNLRLTTDPVGNQLLINYDTRGRKSSTVDPDLGSWSYVEDGFGDLVSQTDAKSQTTTMTHDGLGRMLTKTDSTGTAQLVWDTAPGGGIGKLAAMISAPDPNLAGPCTIPFVTTTDGNRAGKSYKYTTFGDVQEIDECADGSTFVTSFQYDAQARQSQVRYPVVGNSQLAVGYHYTGQGYLQYLTDDSTDYSVLWQGKAMNPLGELTDEQMRNGVETQSTLNPQTGWLLNTMATAHANNNEVIQNWTYGFDEIGNLLTRTRTDAVNTVTSSETFGYDLINRLTSSLVTTSGGYNHLESYAYDPIGNITQKAGNSYAYQTGCLAGETRSAGPHAVCSVAGTTFAYDDNGNITHNSNRSFAYNSANKVTAIQSDQSGGPNVTFMYGAEGNRVVQAVTNGGKTSRTVYVGLDGTGKSFFEQTTTHGAPSQYVNFIYAGASHGGNALAVRVMTDGGVVSANRYYSFDHLGSITAMSDEQGHVAATETSSLAATALGYDAWGMRRNPDGTAATDPTSFDLPVGDREFTGQEQIPDFDLVNMNGRVYDPSLGRFLTPDPNVQFISNLQSYNRYAYAGNNPLRYTDPTGFFWDEIGDFFKNTFSNPITDIELGLSLAVCIGSSGAECFTLGMVLAAENAGIALANGASFGQTVLNTAIGVGIGIASSELGSVLKLNGWQSFIYGEASTAISAMISNVASGRSPLGYNVLGAVLLSTAEAAITLGIQKAIAVSQASADDDDDDGLHGIRKGPKPNLSGRDPTDQPICGTDVACVVVHSSDGRSPAMEDQDAAAMDVATRETDGYRNARVATVDEGSEYGTEINAGVPGDTRKGEDYQFQPDLPDDPADNPDAIVHTHLSPIRSASVGDITWAENHNIGVYTVSSSGYLLYYAPSTHVQYYLEYMGQVP
jgi:RHS repeat-associated protein